MMEKSKRNRRGGCVGAKVRWAETEERGKERERRERDASASSSLRRCEKETAAIGRERERREKGEKRQGGQGHVLR
jgi:hypothetical protein